MSENKSNRPAGSELTKAQVIHLPPAEGVSIGAQLIPTPPAIQPPATTNTAGETGGVAETNGGGGGTGNG
jgi:hypothetical protein